MVGDPLYDIEAALALFDDPADLLEAIVERDQMR